MGYSIVIKDPPGIISLCENAFCCPNCNTHHDDSFYEKQLQKSEKGYIYKKCTNCGKKIGIAADMRGDVKVWLKENEQK